MAEDKVTKGMMATLLKELRGQEKQSPLEKAAAEAVAKAREGRGMIGGLLAGEKAKIDVAKEYTIATKGTLGKRQAFFEGLLGRDLGNLFQNLDLEKKESPERIKELREKFGLDKKEKSARAESSVGKLSKPLSLILRKIIETQKLVQKIQQNIAKPASNSKYVFDPRMGGTGRFRDVTTNKLVSSKVAIESGAVAPGMSRTDALTAAIGADETPLVKLREFLEFKFKDFDAQKVNKQLSSIDGKLDMILLAVGADAISDLIPDMDVDLDKDKKDKKKTRKRTRRVPSTRRVPTRKPPGRLSGLRNIGSAVRTAATGATGTAVLAGGAALAITGGGLYALDRGLTKAGEEAEAKMDVLESKYGLKTLKNERGFTSGYEVQGKKYGLNDLPQEYKDLIDAYGPGDKRSFSARSALKKIQENPEKYKALEVSGTVKAMSKDSSLVESPEGAAIKPATVSVPSPSTLPTESPPGAAVVAPAMIPPVEEQKKSFGAITSSAISSAYAGVKKFVGIESPAADDLGKYVRLKDSSVNLDGLNEQMKSRLAALAKDYFDQTGQKIQVNSAYRSPEEQAKLFAKYGTPRAAPPGRSRHESGLAVDINSSDANKAIDLGLMSKYGFTRPVRGETWHIEPIETAKRGGTPDNPYKPGDPIVAANEGKEVNPESGTKPSASLIADRLPDSGATPAAGLGPAGQPRGEGMTIAGNGLATREAAAPGLVTPVQKTNGMQIAEGSAALASSAMVAQATPPAPVVINNQSGNQQPIQPPKMPLPKASSRSSENSFNRALAKDFSHPTAFTSVGVV
jgi:hypothetical protein